MFMTQIPSYIENRIRRAAPLDSSIVLGSTPVISFGDALNAKVATLGINPSRVEFLDREGVELCEGERRLATHRSLGFSDLSKAPESVIAQVLDNCVSYFSKNPYMQWFNPLEQLLRAVGTSYYDGSACHLDLVQWATDPTWGGLKPSTLRKSLIAADAQFLLEQLSNENIKFLLVNGSGVISELERFFQFKLKEIKPITGFSRTPARLFTGKILGRINVIGWSTNLQSSFGVTLKLRKELADRIAECTHV
jgi:hypothetical protein